MALSYAQRPYTNFSRLPGRKVRGVVLHHSAGSTPIDTFQSAGSWHWQIGKDTLYRDVPEPFVAWHDAATDRWRPPWVPVGAGKGKTSDINAVSIGIELVYAPQNGEVPNAYQYDTLKALMADLYTRYGELPTVGHGQTDRNRWPSEPHQLDWARAHFSLPRPEGRYFVVVPPKPSPPEVPDMKLLEDWQVKGWVLADLYQQAGVPFNPDAATATAWVSELREGRYRGRPCGPEHAIEGGVWQEFDFGAVVWRASDGALSWEG